MRIRTFVVVGGALVLAMAAGGAWALGQVPAGAEIPVHWGLDGQPDGYAPAWIGLFGVPALAAVVLVVLALAPRVEPRRENLERSLTAYVGMGVAIIALTGLLQVGVIASALGRPVDVASLAIAGVGALVIVIGNYLGKTRSNWLMGIRTPWTLSSERSWARTHRLGGLVFVGIGLAVMATTLLLGPRTALWVLLGSLAVGVPGVVAYSYVVWRDDPDRRQNAIGG